MRFTETANPKQLAIMTNAFDEYCLVRTSSTTMARKTPHDLPAF